MTRIRLLLIFFFLVMVESRSLNDSDSVLVPLFDHGTDYLDNPMKYDLVGGYIGIVLGHTHFRVGFEGDNGQLEYIPNEFGNTRTPNWISFTDNGTVLIGDSAEDRAILNPQATMFNVKQLLARKFDHPEVQREIEASAYKIVNKDEKPYVEIEFGSGEIKLYSPEEMVALFLRKIKDMAENHFRRRMRKAIIVVPDYIEFEQRFTLELVAKQVGFNHTRVVPAHIAALVVHDLQGERGIKNCLVFHVSAGACEVNVVEIDHGFFGSLTTSSDTHLGGKEFTQRLVNYFVRLIRSKYGRDLVEDKKALRKLVKECDRAKISLSSQEQVVVKIKSLNVSESLSRTKFEELNSDLFEKSIRLVESALEEARLKHVDFKDIVLVGESTRIPKLRKLLKDFFGGKEPTIAARVNPDDILLKGVLVDVHPADNPIGELFLGEVLSLSVGIQTAGGVMTKMIRESWLVPTWRKELFTTNRDNVSAVEIKVYKGEMRLAKDCFELGRFNLTGIVPVPRGLPRIEITFRVDSDNRIHVNAEDKVSNISAGFSQPLYLYSGLASDSSYLSKLHRMWLESAEEEDRMYWLTKSNL